MLTFFAFISTIHGCSSIRHGVARRLLSFSRLCNKLVSTCLCSCSSRKSKTYQHSMKYLKFSLQRIPASCSSRSFGIG